MLDADDGSVCLEDGGARRCTFQLSKKWLLLQVQAFYAPKTYFASPGFAVGTWIQHLTTPLF